MADIVNPGASAGGPLNAGSMPSTYDLDIYKGDYLELYVTIKDSAGNPINLTGFTPKAQLKADYSAGTAVDFTTTITGVTGQVKIYLSSTTSSSLTPGSYIWDFQITDTSGQTRTYLTGDVTVFNEVTT